ncbi:tetratricopeptide repeat protein [candidate division WOR-3 bacterium]|jgi:tetratricopeptide (TPR) repeat protein|nr:tetratricopeptide repeat protein [candidate division WOR-3 bacterium]
MDIYIKRLKTRLTMIESKVNRTTNPKEKELIKKQLIDMYDEIKDIRKDIDELESKLKKVASNIKTVSVQNGDKQHVKSFIQAMKVSPVNVLTMIDEGWNRIIKEDYDKAIEILKKTIELSPDEIEATNLLSWALMKKGLYDDAMIFAQKVMIKSPNDPIAHTNMGFIMYKKKNYGEAIECLSKVIHENRNKKATIYSRFYLGLIYLDRGMYIDALEHFKKTIELSPNLYEVYYHMGLTFEMAGNKELAIKSWQKCFNINKYTIWAKKSKEKLRDYNISVE